MKYVSILLLVIFFSFSESIQIPEDVNFCVSQRLALKYEKGNISIRGVPLNNTQENDCYGGWKVLREVSVKDVKKVKISLDVYSAQKKFKKNILLKPNQVYEKIFKDVYFVKGTPKIRTSVQTTKISELEKDKRRIDRIMKLFVKHKNISLKKISKLGVLVEEVINKNKNEEVENLRGIFRNMNETSNNVNQIYQKYLLEKNNVNQVKIGITELKKVIKEHYEQMKSDSEYLKRLKLIKPKYFESLKIIEGTIKRLNTTIDRNIRGGNHKDEMFKIMNFSRNHTMSVTEILSKLFLEHYEKYKNKLELDEKEYGQEQKQLVDKQNSYQIGLSKMKIYEKEYQRLLRILNRLKGIYGNSREEMMVFDEVIKIVKFIFKNPMRIKSFYEGEIVNGKCAHTIMKTHMKNKLM